MSGGTHRLITDRAHKRYFGYDLHVEPLSDGQTIRFTVAPLNLSRHELELGSGWT